MSKINAIAAEYFGAGSDYTAPGKRIKRRTITGPRNHPKPEAALPAVPAMSEVQALFEEWAARDEYWMKLAPQGVGMTYISQITEGAYRGFVAAMEMGKEAFQIQFNKG